MRALIQRVNSASVTVDETVVGEIGRGLLVLLGVQRGDDSDLCVRLARKVAAYRVFPDEQGRMNRSVVDIDGQVLVVSQFTLAADTRKGLRPSFTPAAEPAVAERLYRQFIDVLENDDLFVATGRFGADMKVSLCNDGPVTFLLEVD